MAIADKHDVIYRTGSTQHNCIVVTEADRATATGNVHRKSWSTSSSYFRLFCSCHTQLITQR